MAKQLSLPFNTVEVTMSKHAAGVQEMGLDAYAASQGLDPYYYARDHDAGPGAWCVRGPKGFEVSVGDKNIAYIVGKLLSGKTDEAVSMAKDMGWRT